MLDQLLFADVDALASQVPDGAKVAICKSETGVPCDLVRALVRAGVRDLHVIGVPTGGYACDLLIGAGCVATMETSAVTLDETGLAPRFIAAVKSGGINIMDSTCPAVYSGLRAGEKGIPFIPIRGLLGSDVLRHREDYKVIDNPFGHDDEIVLVPAIEPEFSLIHVTLVDDEGNVYVGLDRDLALMGHASKQTLVTAEARYPGSLLEDQQLAAATMAATYVGGVAICPNGAWPLKLNGCYDEDLTHMADYRRLAMSEQGFREYLDTFVVPVSSSIP
jgi:glutaconate CoA-transferase subunit A